MTYLPPTGLLPFRISLLVAFLIKVLAFLALGHISCLRTPRFHSSYQDLNISFLACCFTQSDGEIYLQKYLYVIQLAVANEKKHGHATQ